MDLFRLANNGCTTRFDDDGRIIESQSRPRSVGGQLDAGDPVDQLVPARRVQLDLSAAPSHPLC